MEVKMNKKTMKAIAFFIAIFVPFASFCEIPPFALITIPKSGSHLIIKTLYFLTGSKPIWHTKFPSYQYLPGEEGFLYTHFCVSPQLEADYGELPNLKKIIMVRDLRDVAVSIVHQIVKAPWPGLSGKKRQEFLQMPFDEQLLYVINYNYDVRAVAKTSPNSLQVSLVQVADQALRYSQNPDVLTLRYEDLVGPNGGGTLDAQIAQLGRIKEFLQIDATAASLYEIAAKIYGNTIDPFGQEGFKNLRSTFRVGKISRWREHFTEEHKAAFKKKLGKTLIALGYEQDEKW
jgi:hypothetical protein